MLPELKDAINSLTTDLTNDQVCELWARVQQAKNAIKDIDAKLKDAMIEWCEANGDLTIGQTRYYVGTKSTVKCPDVQAVLGCVLSQTGGDLDAVGQCLSAGAWKHGAVKGVVGDVLWDRLFERVIEPDLKTGQPRKELKAARPE